MKTRIRQVWSQIVKYLTLIQICHMYQLPPSLVKKETSGGRNIILAKYIIDCVVNFIKDSSGSFCTLRNADCC